MASKSMCILLILMASSILSAAGKDNVCYCNEGGTANCSNQHLGTVPTISCGTSDLVVLNLSWNNISVLERGVFQKLVMLQDLFLDNVHIRLVHKDAFNKLKDLRKLDLSFNNIEQLNSETFQYLENLQELRLRQNPLKVLPDKIFSSLKSLSILDLRSCELAYISEENFLPAMIPKTTLASAATSAWPPNLYIDVNDNPLECNCALKDLHDLVLRSSQTVQYENLTCTQPEDLRGYPLRALDSADLKCKPYEILFPLRNTTFLAPRGRNVTLSCRIANDPHLPWLKRWTFHADNREVESVVPETSPRFVLSSSNLWLNLTIERVRRSDEGVYTCEVENRSVRLRNYRKVRLVVFEDFEYVVDQAAQTSSTSLLVVSVMILATFISVVVLITAVARKKPDVYKKRTLFKKNRDFMINVPFYASADVMMPTRPLPMRPGSEVLPWWLEYPEHLYEDIDRKHSFDHPTKQAAQPGEVQYDGEHYLRPTVPREAAPSRQYTTPSYITVLPDED